MPTQKTFRADADFLETIEERALQESLRTGLTVTFSDLVRRGLELVLGQPLPDYSPGRVPCDLYLTGDGGLGCRTCKIKGVTRGSIACPRLKREVKLGE